MRAEATEYQARYVPRVPRDGEYAGAIGAYLGLVLPHYAENFLDWWQNRLRPEIERNFAYLDGHDTTNASFAELAVLFEDAIDIHDRHWKIHWMLNFAQFSATHGPQRRGRGGTRRRPDAELHGPAHELGRGPQLGLDRGPLEHEGGDQGRRRAARRVRGPTPRAA